LLLLRFVEEGICGEGVTKSDTLMRIRHMSVSLLIMK